MTIIEYVTEEVRRQGHDVTAIDGIERVGWMLDAWCYALQEVADGRLPEMSDALIFGRSIERGKVKGMRRVGVRVGSRMCPSPEEVRERLPLLFQQRDSLKPMDFYRVFEEIHPFVDGNGRTGKILLNWLNGTLDNPIFPPNDFWGEWIQNP